MRSDAWSPMDGRPAQQAANSSGFLTKGAAARHRLHGQGADLSGRAAIGQQKIGVFRECVISLPRRGI